MTDIDLANANDVPAACVARAMAAVLAKHPDTPIEEVWFGNNELIVELFSPERDIIPFKVERHACQLR